MAAVDCKKCSNTFQTFKLYVQHLLFKECKEKQKAEGQVSDDPKSQRLKVSPKLFQKKRKHESDSSTAPDQTFKMKIVQNSKAVKITPVGILNPHSTTVAPAQKPEKASCSLCNKLVKGRGLTQHLNIQHKCRYCSKLVGDVEEHISQVHEREPCQHCGKKFADEAAVEKHIEDSHLQTCEQCKEQFYSKEKLQTHVVDIHESEKCDICNTKFLIQEKMMDEHKEKVHGIKAKTIKQFGGMMFMMVSD